MVPGSGDGARLFTAPGGFGLGRLGRDRRLEAGFGDGGKGAGDGVLAREGQEKEQPGQEEYDQGDEQEQASSRGPLAGLSQLPAASPALASGGPRLLERIRSG